MKWIRWDEFGRRFASKNSTDEGVACHHFTSESLIVCEKDTNWREIESGVLNTDDGKLHITLKPVPKVLSVPDAWLAYKGFYASSWWLGSSAWASLTQALDREASPPANPYTKEAVDELLDAVREVHPGYFSRIDWKSDESRRLSAAFIALKKQREAANA